MTAYVPKDFWAGRAKRLSRQESNAGRHIGEYNPKGVHTGPELRHLSGCLAYTRVAEVLDIGTGYGMMALWLRQQGVLDSLDYTACDFVDDYIALHEETVGIRPVKWDGVTLPFDDASFDFVMAYAVLLHVTPGDLAGVFGEMVRTSRCWIYVHTARPMKNLDYWGFNHDYYKLYRAFGLHGVDELESTDGKRVNWLLRKGDINENTH